MFDFADPVLVALARDLHAALSPAGVVIVRARPDVIEVLASTGNPLGWSFGEQVAPGDTISHHVVEMDRELIIDDAFAHPLVRDSVSVTGCGVASYVGMPYHAEGRVIGVLALVDIHARVWEDWEIDTMRAAARRLDEMAETRAAPARGTGTGPGGTE
ncbi:GAF domain-containing protein [Celeribacter indicus]|uniref:Anti-sigma-factor antagonist n=1 Tax=Celeribacter indicus TaxID=1208324 RepID=A0A0B5DTF6_9RHOB|nr:GAF domain-containing protein [Celeribacter indicus]AJE46354.1 anti-sigma-factor antagonist [Celeribacter indicus]SDW54340.1 GAF domain-containing protein [Celeribacter indicus]